VDFFILPSPSNRTMALGSTQPLTEMSTRNLPGSKGRSAPRADNVTAISEPIVWKMWELQRLTTLWASTACYRDSCTFTLQMYLLKLYKVNMKHSRTLVKYPVSDFMDTTIDSVIIEINFFFVIIIFIYMFWKIESIQIILISSIFLSNRTFRL
jgi:hypothetical protein